MRIGVLSLAIWVCLSGLAAAQVSPPVLVAPRSGADEASGTCVSGATVRVIVRNGSRSVTLTDVPCTNGRFKVDLTDVVVRIDSELDATQTIGSQTSAPFTGKVTLAGPFGDEREDFEASAYVGLAIDSFAAEEVRKYLNPEANGVKYERSIFGIDFAYRVHGSSDGGPQVWVYGETLHGVRSEGIDCSVAPNLPSCQTELAQFAGNIPANALFMLRNASSLEAFVGGRYEFLSLNLPGKNPARVYVKGQLGFIELIGSDGDAKDMHHVAIGATAVGGSRQGSYLEVGLGRTDLFLLNRHRRLRSTA